MNVGPSLLDRLFRVLTVLLAVGNAAWFVLTFPIYFRWVYQEGVVRLPIYLLWFFVGLPSLACAVVALRRAALHGGGGILLKASFLTLLAICAWVVLLLSWARWSADPDPAKHFPWITWLATACAGLGLAIYSLRGGGVPSEVSSGIEPRP